MEELLEVAGARQVVEEEVEEEAEGEEEEEKSEVVVAEPEVVLVKSV